MMPICKKCHVRFSCNKWIEGKKKNLANRSYCLDCSPFKSHNTRKLHIGNKCVLARCKTCGKNYAKGHGRYKEECNSCRVSAWRVKIKKEIVEIAGGGCKICGYCKCISALEFHHLDTSKKEFNISKFSSSKSRIIEETKKCILICCRCHREIHAGIITIGE